MIHYIQTMIIPQRDPDIKKYREQLLEDDWQIKYEDTGVIAMEKSVWFEAKGETDE